MRNPIPLLPAPGTRLIAGFLVGLSAFIGVWAFRGFTVDDALISARVAHHIATGYGYRFNPNGPVVDAVTPLGWAYVLAPFASRSSADALSAARILGATAWVVSAIWLGGAMHRIRAAFWPLSFLAILAPVGLWASAGMETAVVMALTTFATGPNLAHVGCLGLAAAWRPEMIPFAFALTIGRAKNLRQVSRDLCIAVGPAIVVACLRLHFFGSAQPLAVVAKPSDITHGYWYALEALLWTGPIWLWLGAGRPWQRSEPAQLATAPSSQRQHCQWRCWLPGWPVIAREETAIAIAVIVHFVAVALAGGDWMPAYRLVVPVMPAMLRVACCLPRQRMNPLRWFGVAVALLVSIGFAVRWAPSARRIVVQRNELIHIGGEVLKDATAVAAPDVGWVGAAFAGKVVDLAGATDPAIARFHGGHTSKRITTRTFVTNQVDRVLLLLAPEASLNAVWSESQFARVVDFRAAKIAEELACSPQRVLAIPFTHQSYLVLRCPNP